MIVLSSWNINYGTDLISSKAQSIYQSDSNNNSVAQSAVQVSSDYAQILAERITEVNQQFEEMRENLENQQQSSAMKSTYTKKRFMPDGSMMITTYEDGQITSQIKKKPHLVATPDYNAPTNADGSPAMKMESKFNLLDLLMM